MVQSWNIVPLLSFAARVRVRFGSCRELLYTETETGDKAKDWVGKPTMMMREMRIPRISVTFVVSPS